jgi:hypothetical protein
MMTNPNPAIVTRTAVAANKSGHYPPTNKACSI